MSYRPYQQITRRKSRQIHVGRVPVGGDAPITVQTMTNTLTTDVAAPSRRSGGRRRPGSTSCASPARTRRARSR